MKKSKGHIAFVGDFEYYVQRGEIYKALLQNAFDLDGYRHGRWEAPDRESTYKYKIQPHIDYVKKVGYRVTVGSKYKKRLDEETVMHAESLDDLFAFLQEAMQTTLFKPHELGAKDVTAGKRVHQDAKKLVAKNPGLDKFKRQGTDVYSGYADKAVMKKLTDVWMAWMKKHRLKYAKGGSIIGQKLVISKSGPGKKYYPTVVITARETGKGIYVNIMVLAPGAIS